jgi:ATP-dependent helicase/nuclease subunit A
LKKPSTTQPNLFDQADDQVEVPAAPPDQAARDFATDPRHHVVLEASAGTGKTRVLVDRYVRLLAAGVDPRHILAMTFTRKAAAEMRERVLATVRRAAEARAFSAEVWSSIQGRLGDVQITTIDGFCFGLLREFPLEADVDPAFEVADETEMARFTREALDITLRLARALVRDDENVRLLLVRVKQPVLRDALGMLIDRRQVSVPAVARFVGRDEQPANAVSAGRRFVVLVQAALLGRSTTALIDDGPVRHPEFQRLANDLTALGRFPADDPIRVQALRRRLDAYFLTRNGEPRKRLTKPYSADQFATPAGRRRHEAAMAAVSPELAGAIAAFDADVSRLLARGLLRVLVIGVSTYERLLEEHALLDFSGMLDRAVALLERQEEFARSRLKLQSRYHHLLVDEFQDTSRRQWRLVELLINAWAEGEGAADEATSVFIVGDRKQSIYRFRHAEVTLLDEAADRIAALRPARRVRQAISTSFRAVPELLAFVNALSAGITSGVDLPDRWRYEETDRFPTPDVADGARRDGAPVLGIVAQASMESSAAAVADEVVRLLRNTVVRDRTTGPRAARPDDVAILFRARAGHKYFEDALESRGVRTYVYKGLGFFDAPEVQDLQALLRFLARPDSDTAAAAFLRSRFVRLSDEALAAIGPAFSAALVGGAAPPADAALSDVDRGLLARVRIDLPRWLSLSEQVPPGELLDVVLRESAYVFETGGRRLDQARENIKKVRALVRRVENRGYATLDRLAGYFDTLRAGDDSNAVIEAAGAVNLMTIHAAKGLEFPIVFVVNLHAAGRGRSAGLSVIDRGPSGESEVVFGATDATELEDQREAEELRRLMYVAVTRARDRLYLAAEVKPDGALKRGARSLAALLPLSLASVFTAAQNPSASDVEWVSEYGSFAFAVCRPAVVPAVMIASPDPTALESVSSPGSIRASGLVITSATAMLDAESTRAPLVDGADSARPGREGRLVGTLVHRLLQRQVELGANAEEAAARVEGLLTHAERGEVGEVEPVVRLATELYASVLRRPEVASLLASGRCYYEVPFSYLPPDQPGVCVRGAVDCLVVGPTGTATVLEFKTGRPRPEHEAQVRLYARAMEAILGLGPVGTLVCYP